MARRSGSESWSMPRASPRFLSAVFHSRYLATTSLRSLCALVTLRYSAASAMTEASAILAVSSSYLRSSSSSLCAYCMELGYYESPALLGLERHRSFQGVNRDRGLRIVGRLGGDALEPQPRSRHHAHERALARSEERRVGK